jgi:nucleotide-binding universal stress UspA family protein
MTSVSITSALFVVMIIWVVIGLVTGIVMGRRGHSWFGWTAIGCVLGPLVIPVAIGSVGQDREMTAITIARGEAGTGRLRIVVGIDGSAESLMAVRAVINLLGDRIGTLTLAAVIDFDAARSGWKGADQQDAETALADAAQVVSRAWATAPETVLLAGVPARALLEHATTSGADVLAIGSRGRGASKALLGSVATHLAANAPVPVLVIGKQDGTNPGP